MIKPKVKRKFLFLLVSLLLLFFFYPFVQRSPAADIILDIVFLVILLSSIYAISERKKFFFIALLLAVAGFGPTILNYFFATLTLRLVSVSAYGLFFILMAIEILSTIMKAKKVTTETIYASICVYLLLGIIWTMLYSAIEITEPGSFLSGGAVIDVHEDHARRNLYDDFSYYTFVTLTTLGYGDITPVSPIARALSSLEAVIGQLYIAVLIAGLVGIRFSQSGRNDRLD